ncbi:MAG: hypothetical protein ACPGKV_10725, partial [Alteromonas macleodii]
EGRYFYDLKITEIPVNAEHTFPIKYSPTRQRFTFNAELQRYTDVPTPITVPTIEEKLHETQTLDHQSVANGNSSLFKATIRTNEKIDVELVQSRSVLDSGFLDITMERSDIVTTATLRIVTDEGEVIFDFGSELDRLITMDASNLQNAGILDFELSKVDDEYIFTIPKGFIASWSEVVSEVQSRFGDIELRVIEDDPVLGWTFTGSRNDNNNFTCRDYPLDDDIEICESSKIIYIEMSREKANDIDSSDLSDYINYYSNADTASDFVKAAFAIAAGKPILGTLGAIVVSNTIADFVARGIGSNHIYATFPQVAVPDNIDPDSVSGFFKNEEYFVSAVVFGSQWWDLNRTMNIERSIDYSGATGTFVPFNFTSYPNSELNLTIKEDRGYYIMWKTPVKISQGNDDALLRLELDGAPSFDDYISARYRNESYLDLVVSPPPEPPTIPGDYEEPLTGTWSGSMEWTCDLDNLPRSMGIAFKLNQKVVIPEIPVLQQSLTGSLEIFNSDTLSTGTRPITFGMRGEMNGSTFNGRDFGQQAWLHWNEHEFTNNVWLGTISSDGEKISGTANWGYYEDGVICNPIGQVTFSLDRE